jgi:hypothetical protein
LKKVNRPGVNQSTPDKKGQSAGSVCRVYVEIAGKAVVGHLAVLRDSAAGASKPTLSGLPDKKG